MTKDRVFEILESLDIPRSQFVVVGSSALVVRNIKTEANDIDIVVSEDILLNLGEKNSGWRRKWFFKGMLLGRVCFQKGCVEAWSDQNYGEYCQGSQYLIATSEKLCGFNFMRLDELAAFKLALGRQKDKKDVLLIVKHLQNVNLRSMRIPWSCA